MSSGPLTDLHRLRACQLFRALRGTELQQVIPLFFHELPEGSSPRKPGAMPSVRKGKIFQVDFKSLSPYSIKQLFVYFNSKAKQSGRAAPFDEALIKSIQKPGNRTTSSAGSPSLTAHRPDQRAMELGRSGLSALQAFRAVPVSSTKLGKRQRDADGRPDQDAGARKKTKAEAPTSGEKGAEAAVPAPASAAAPELVNSGDAQTQANVSKGNADNSAAAGVVAPPEPSKVTEGQQSKSNAPRPSNAAPADPEKKALEKSSIQKPDKEVSNAPDAIKASANDQPAKEPKRVENKPKVSSAAPTTKEAPKQEKQGVERVGDETLAPKKTADKPANKIEGKAAPQIAKMTKDKPSSPAKTAKTKVGASQPKQDAPKPAGASAPSKNSNPKTPKKTKPAADGGFTFDDKKWCQIVLNKLRGHASAEIFLYPVPRTVPKYYDIIKSPMDLKTIGDKLKTGKYGSKKIFLEDLRLIVKNCTLYNKPGTPVYAIGQEFAEYLKEFTSDSDPSVNLGPQKPGQSTTPGGKKRKRLTGGDHAWCTMAIDTLKTHALALPFFEPVSRAIKNYHRVVKRPMDFTTMTRKFERGNYDSKEACVKEIRLIFSNCKLFNAEGTTLHKDAKEMEKVLDQLLGNTSSRRRFTTYKMPQDDYIWCTDILYRVRIHDLAGPFTSPVDPALKEYFRVVKKPVDLLTMGRKLHEGTYTSKELFQKDMEQIFINCRLFNPEGLEIRDDGNKLEEYYRSISK